ncbi:uncharacterized protein LOC133785321 [Humulus lupulus]|uniref:uncharacterized protein LOC133785321 n=1 Tax=Humulus lupulus TaxID=3486 RepID=UPI002B416BED|nr:uncharacterized protein LOC133785321 [Humulus lupulus]
MLTAVEVATILAGVGLVVVFGDDRSDGCGVDTFAVWCFVKRHGFYRCNLYERDLKDRDITSKYLELPQKEWERERERKMHGMWLYLKENVKCGSKHTDVLCSSEKCSHKLSFTPLQKNLAPDSQLVHPIRELIYRKNYCQTCLCELEIGDPSRKIVEIIFQKASLDHSKSTTRIRSIIKVKNSAQTLDSFEKYRDKVKMTADHRCTKNPRNIVDGNEQLRFYGTTMACRRGKSKQVSELCKNPNCRVCRILQSNFRIDYTTNNGIRLSSNSDDFRENVMKNTERTVIVCRIIAGNMSISNGDESNVCNSTGNEKGYNSSGNVIVWDPSAVLPCFVIVFT